MTMRRKTNSVKKLIKLEQDRIDLSISVHIFNILDVNECDGKFTVRFQLYESWKDPELEFTNLNDNTRINTLSEVEMQQIWQPPPITFDNIYLAGIMEIKIML